MRKIIFILLASVIAMAASAQPSVKKVQIILVPNHADAIYKLGEQVEMSVIALNCGVMLNDVDINGR